MTDREHERMPYSVQVEFRTPSSFLVAYSVNLSRGGLFIETDSEIPSGAMVTVDFSIPTAGQISLNGAVSWRRGVDSTDGPPGLGVEFMAISSYGASTRSSGEVKIVKDLDVPIEGRDILVVEDIVDTGLTLSYLLANLHSRGARSVKLAALLDKWERRERAVTIDYLGFKIPDAFVVGYGLDYAERYRNLPYIAVLMDPNA